MRPEYVAAVEAAGWGWTLWIAFAVPAALIWLAAFWRKVNGLRYLAAFAAAVVLCWLLLVFHVQQIEWTKERMMVTEEEQWDWASDTWIIGTSVMAAPVSLAYCTLNAVLAGCGYGACYVIERAIKGSGGR